MLSFVGHIILNATSVMGLEGLYCRVVAVAAADRIAVFHNIVWLHCENKFEVRQEQM